MPCLAIQDCSVLNRRGACARWCQRLRGCLFRCGGFFLLGDPGRASWRWKLTPAFDRLLGAMMSVRIASGSLDSFSFVFLVKKTVRFH